MSVLLICWRGRKRLGIYVNGRCVGSAADDDLFPDVPPQSTPTVAAEVAEVVAQALGARVEVVRS